MQLDDDDIVFKDAPCGEDYFYIPTPRPNTFSLQVGPRVIIVTEKSYAPYSFRLISDREIRIDAPGAECRTSSIGPNKTSDFEALKQFLLGHSPMNVTELRESSKRSTSRLSTSRVSSRSSAQSLKEILGVGGFGCVIDSAIVWPSSKVLTYANRKQFVSKLLKLEDATMEFNNARFVESTGFKDGNFPVDSLEVIVNKDALISRRLSTAIASKFAQCSDVLRRNEKIGCLTLPKYNATLSTYMTETLPTSFPTSAARAPHRMTIVNQLIKMCNEVTDFRAPWTHNDIKLINFGVLTNDDNSPRQLLLADWGIVARLDNLSSFSYIADFTHPAYMSWANKVPDTNFGPQLRDMLTALQAARDFFRTNRFYVKPHMRLYIHKLFDRIMFLVALCSISAVTLKVAWTTLTGSPESNTLISLDRQEVTIISMIFSFLGTILVGEQYSTRLVRPRDELTRKLQSTLIDAVQLNLDSPKLVGMRASQRAELSVSRRRGQRSTSNF
jgi:hypothetical protein